MSSQKLRAHLEALIAQYGMAVYPVMPRGDAPPFAYSVGQQEKGLPELIVFGLPPQVAGAMLYTLAGHMETERAAGRPVGKGFVMVPDIPVRTALLEVPVAAAREYAEVAHERSQGQASYLQVVWPDEAGVFPWEPGYDGKLHQFQCMLGNIPDPAPGKYLH